MRFALDMPKGDSGFISYRIYCKVNISLLPQGKNIELHSNISTKPLGFLQAVLILRHKKLQIILITLTATEIPRNSHNARRLNLGLRFRKNWGDG